MMKLIKFPLKVLALPFIFIFALAAVLVKAVNNLSSYVMGPLILFILGCGIYSAIQQMWRSVAILAVLEVFCLAVMFCAVVIESTLDGMKESLLSFIHS